MRISAYLPKPAAPLSLGFAAVLAAMAIPVGAHDDSEKVYRGNERLGRVEFPVTCKPKAQAEFNRGMALFHSFWFTPSIKSFRDVLAHDPACAMAHWGIAFMSLGNPFAWPANPKAIENAAAALAEAERTGAKTERERDYIAALGAYFRNRDSEPHRARAVALQKAFESLAARYPDDDEAQILHALLLDATALPTDKTFANQTRAAAILEPLLRKHPDHPGVAHYLIHTYDYAELAEKGLSSARVYADIAPSVPHALHMPSHIYSRVGLWPEMVEGNRRSYLAAKAELESSSMGVGTYDALHAMDYMAFGELQQARDEEAGKIVRETLSLQKVNVENFPAAYAFAAIPSRYALERRDWQQAAALKLSPSGLAWEKFPQAEAILVFSRGLGAARLGNPGQARQDLKRLEELKAAMLAANVAYWPSQTDFQIRAVSAWIALAENQPSQALDWMRQAADMEDASDKHPVTPGNVVPSRQLLGEMLLQLQRPAEALVELKRSLARDPNRYQTIAVAARAARAAGDTTAASRYYAELVRLGERAQAQRPELVEARDFLRQ